MKPAILIAILVLGLSVSDAHAAQQEEQIIKSLKEQGFTEIEMTRTWLGRVRIVARGAVGVREIVFNPANGVILRDYQQAAPAHRPPPPPFIGGKRTHPPPPPPRPGMGPPIDRPDREKRQNRTVKKSKV
ncbi:hypothetical protein TRP8649_03250 [Pelagimonas phthalicica]|uniref:PepSY domain-containing protein n=1 Tax=Pelagimonas phthalicica TaxID=1037362 RepID=A0A238JEN5_9RHOB|nr:hypothetical protein [Pelagimonas phthalicica]TDS92068.1 hypothetical protein CLV87_3250 [Pelagimonas phthalicica]SMX29118.1 hypothetical protein TRP8649_03250 [Pelagimonas phthalicica]